jgi:hypothetical protein
VTFLLESRSREVGEVGRLVEWGHRCSIIYADSEESAGKAGRTDSEGLEHCLGAMYNTCV